MSRLISIHQENPQTRLIKQVVGYLKPGSVIIYPTDSGYAFGCKVDDKTALSKIRQIRGLEAGHHFTLMCRNLSELANYGNVDNQAFRLIKNNTPGAYTFILNATKEVPRRLTDEKNKTIGLRISSARIVLSLLDKINGPLLSISLPLPDHEIVEYDPINIQKTLGKQVDVIIDAGMIKQQLTTIVDLTGSVPKILREGVGTLAPFLNR